LGLNIVRIEPKSASLKRFNQLDMKKLEKQEQKGIISSKILSNDSLFVVFDWIDESIGANFKYKYNFIYN